MTLKTIDNDLNRGLLSFRHLEVSDTLKKILETIRLRFAFLNFPSLRQKISVRIKLNRSRLAIVFCHMIAQGIKVKDSKN